MGQVLDQPGNIRLEQIGEHLRNAVRVEFGQHLPALGFTADQFEDFPLLLWRGQMDDDLGGVGGMHPTQHLGQIRDGTTPQQALNRQQDDVGLGVSPLALISQCVAQHIFVPRAGFRIERARFGGFFDRLHD